VDDATYMRWKGWDPGTFGAIPPGSRHYFEQLFEGALRPGQAGLEIGFGHGALLAWLRESGLVVAGTELNTRLVELAAAAGFAAFAGAPRDVEGLQARRFDLIVGIDVAEHMTQEQLHELFAWARDHLAPGGRMVLRFPEGSSPLGLANQHGDFTHVTCLTRTKVESLALATGLRVVSYRDDLVSSNRLCALGWPGRLVLHLLQLYARLLSATVRLLLAPLNTPLRLTANSVAVLESDPGVARLP
jgi:SAM-dependent methyltransferase